MATERWSTFKNTGGVLVEHGYPWSIIEYSGQGRVRTVARVKTEEDAKMITASLNRTNP